MMVVMVRILMVVLMVVMLVWGKMDDQVRLDVNHPILIQETLSLRCQDHQEQGLIGWDKMEMLC